MPAQRDRWSKTRLRRLGAGLAVALSATLAFAAPASAQFLPQGFFDTVPPSDGRAEIEANTLGYDGNTGTISAEGRVIMAYSGFTIHCDQLRYNQGSGELYCLGNAAVRDPSGMLYQGDRIEVTGQMKQAFIESLTLTTPAGATITADEVTYAQELRTVLVNGAYSPCGECIDSKGQRIGWKVRAARMVRDEETDIIYLEQPTLEVLGVPVAWIPWIALPDPTKTNGFQLPTVDYKPTLGVRATVPYAMTVGDSASVLLSPMLMSRQGFLMAAEWEQRLEYGRFDVKASGLYQLDPSAFAGTVGDRDWRGAIQTSGHFTLTEDWDAGWSYTAFTDAAYLIDYGLREEKNAVNEVYATHLSDDHFADLRVQRFNLLGNVNAANQGKQALLLPNVAANSYFDLGPNGQVRTMLRFQGVLRDVDSTGAWGGVDYVFGYEGQKYHATAEASWQNQIVGPGGIVATPYLGLRADVTSYEDGTATPGEPSDQMLFDATPVAAMDVRWPLIASTGFDTHLLEPIAQMVWRGSAQTQPGVTNDNAHSFVLDDTNIFSYDRFTGTDRQETGLRANFGLRYLANFEGGRWLELIAGQSFHLAGVNGMAIGDEVNTGVSSGLGSTASYVVLGARGSPFAGATLGAKLQLDPSGPRVARAGVGAEYRIDGYFVGTDYIYLAADPALGVTADQHEVQVRGGAPLPFDYWKVDGSFSWDLAASSWLEATGGITYDDGYFLAGAFGRATGPTHSSPNDIGFGVTFRLKGPDTNIGF